MIESSKKNQILLEVFLLISDDWFYQINQEHFSRQPNPIKEETIRLLTFKHICGIVLIVNKKPELYYQNGLELTQMSVLRHNFYAIKLWTFVNIYMKNNSKARKKQIVDIFNIVCIYEAIANIFNNS